MPSTCPNLVALAAAGLLLLIPFFTLAAPTMIAQEFTRSPTASTSDSPTGMMSRVAFDVGYSLGRSFRPFPIFDIFSSLFAQSVLFIFITGIYAWLGGWFDSVSLRVLTDSKSLFFLYPNTPILITFSPFHEDSRVRTAYRTFTDWLAFLRLDTLFQWLADAIIGTQTIPATDGGGALPAPLPPPQSPTPDSDPRPGGVSATPDPATSPSDHHNIAHPPPV